MPSRVSFLTGQYPGTLNITHMGVPVPASTVTLPHYVKPAGYATANIGKLHFLPHANRDHREQHPNYGFDHLDISDEPGCYEDAYRAWVRRKAPEQLDAISVGLPPAAETWYRALAVKDTVKHPEERFPKAALPFRGSDDVTHTAFVAEQTMEFIEQRQSQSWLCVAGFYSPHSPWVAPQRFLDLYDPSQLSLPEFPPHIERGGEKGFTDDELRSARHGYYAMISEVDHHVGRILDHLERLGLRDDTLIVFTSDHGEWLGDHLAYGKSYPGHDPVSRVPLMISGPKQLVQRGVTVSDIVEAIDVLPTLLDSAAIQIPAKLQGQSLWPALTGTGRVGKGAALMEESKPRRSWKSLRSDKFRYIRESDGVESLYDLTAPHGEYHNVAGNEEYGQALSEMRLALLDRLITRERPLPRAWPY
jgi:arylsulfatase A-like enzyme